MERGERFAVVYDSSELRAPEPGTNQILTEFLSRHRDELGERCAGIGYYITEPKLLAAIKEAEQTATPEQKAAMPVPTRTYDTWAQVQRWARERVNRIE